MKIYKCDHCGNVIEMLNPSGVPIVCCGSRMTELIPGTSDGAAEKHVPSITVNGSMVTVQIGEILHPSIPEHHIEWIALETKKGTQRVNLKAGDVPQAEFILTDDDELIAAYEYCNLHGLWQAN